MANTVIKLKSSGVTGNVPNNLEPGELAINYVDGKLFYGNTSCNAILFDVNNPAGLEGELQFNNSGEFGSSANLKFDNTTKTLNVKNVFANGNVVTDTLTVIRTTNLGNVSNVTITGGSANQFLITDGLGNLSFGVGTMGAQGAAGAQGAVGAQGAQGAQGVVGAQGAQGVAGAQGVQGATGQAAPWEVFTANTTAVTGQQLIANTYGGTFTITLPATPYIGNVVRITDGYDWSINNLVIARNGSTIEGTTSDVIVDVKGTTVEFVYDNVTWQVVSTIGPMGNTGPQGIQGTIGPQGFQGVAGAQGALGAQGDVGAQGVQGAVGAQGVQGATGAQGAIGAQGVQGATGAQGAQGPQGSTPTIGGSNTQIQFNNAGSLGASDNLVWNGTGLGIGKNNPAYPLDVVGYMRGTANNASVGNASSMQFIQNGSGDAAISFLIGATTEWLAGVDNSDSDSFKISNITGGGDFTATGVTLTTAGNWGISETTPTAKLHIGVASAGVNGTKGVRIANPAGTIVMLECGSGGDSFVGTESGSNFNIRTNNGINATFLTNGNVGFGETNPTQRIHFKGSSTTYALAETTGSGTSSGFRMKAGANTDYTLYTTEGGNQFAIYNNVTSTQPLTIDANNNLGLNTNSPNLGRFSDATTAFLAQSTGVSSGTNIFASNSTNAKFIGLWSGHSGAEPAIGVKTGNAFTFGKWAAINGTGGFTENMRIDSSGKVGIGTTNPQTTLDIRSDTSGNTTIDNGITLLNASGVNDTPIGIRMSTYGDATGNQYPKQFIGAIRDGAFGGGKGSIVFCNRNAADTSVVTMSDERARITYDGNLGLGTTSPAEKLHVAGAIRSSSNAIDFSGSVGATFDYYASQARFAVYNGTTTSTMSYSTAGILAIASGIAFPATQSASGNANTLDDYEEGTFTPYFTFGGGSTGITYSATRQVGQYTKIGNVVYYYIHVELTSKGSSTGQFLITGLPFTVVGAENYVPASSFLADMASITGSLMVRASVGSTTCDAYQVVSSSYSMITNSNFTNTTGLQVSGFYRTT